MSFRSTVNSNWTLVMLNMFMYLNFPPIFYPCHQQHSNYKHVFSIRVENTDDPDQMASSEASWSGSTVFSKKDKSWFSKSQTNWLNRLHRFAGWSLSLLVIYSYDGLISEMTPPDFHCVSIDFYNMTCTWFRSSCKYISSWHLEFAPVL